MIYRGRRLIKTCFNSVIRQLFREDPIFPWDKRRLESKIYINESFSEGERKFPNVIISDTTTGNFFHFSYDRNFQEEVKDEMGYYVGSRFGSSLFPTMNVEIQTLNEFEMEILTDRIDSFFEYGGVQKFRDAGITIQSISASTPTPEKYGTNNIYKVVYTFQLYTEWETFIKPEEEDLIEKIEIPDIGVIYQEGNKEKVWLDNQKKDRN